MTEIMNTSNHKAPTRRVLASLAVNSVLLWHSYSTKTITPDAQSSR